MAHTAKRKTLIATAIVVALACATLWAWQRLAFPTTGYYRQLIASADRVEVRAFLINDEAGGTDFLVLTDPQDIVELADSIRIVGLWIPFDELVANSYRLRVIRNSGTTDVIIRGGARIRSGMWHAEVDDRFVSTMEELAQKHRAAMPDWKALLRQPPAGS